MDRDAVHVTVKKIVAGREYLLNRQPTRLARWKEFPMPATHATKLLGAALTAAIATGALALPTAATAATVSERDGVVMVVDAAAEANVLRLSPRGGLTVSETGSAPLLDGDAADACVPDAAQPGRTTCAGVTRVVVRAGGGADVVTTLRTLTLPMRLEGGAGSDRLAAGSGNDTIHGGEGADAIAGGDGDDRLEGQAGNDTFIPNQHRNDGGDYMEGAGGFDTITYAANTSGVVLVDGTFVDADPAEPEYLTLGDSVAVERYIGGSGPDRFEGTARDDWGFNSSGGRNVYIGNGGNDRITAGARADRLVGGAGNDVLDAGTGADVVVAGAGDDQLVLRDGDADHADGGDGVDVATADSRDVLRRIERQRR